MGTQRVRRAFPPFAQMVSLTGDSSIRRYDFFPWSELQVVRVRGDAGLAVLQRASDDLQPSVEYLETAISMELPMRDIGDGQADWDGIVGDAIEGGARVYASGLVNLHVTSELLTFVMSTRREMGNESRFGEAAKRFASTAGGGDILLLGFVPLNAIAEIVAPSKDKGGDVRLLVGDAEHPAGMLVSEDLGFMCHRGMRPVLRNATADGLTYRKTSEKTKLDALSLRDYLSSAVTRCKGIEPERAELGKGLLVERWPDRPFDQWLSGSPGPGGE